MHALLMAGGRGQRLEIEDAEKPLLAYKGKPFFVRVYNALEGSQVDSTVIVTSPHTPRTTSLAEAANMRVAEAPGEGYIEDYRWTIKRLHICEPVLIVAADLPLLTSPIIDKVIDHYKASTKAALAVYVRKEFSDVTRSDSDFVLHACHQVLVPAAVNIVDGRHVDEIQQEAIVVLDDVALRYNINTVTDLQQLADTNIA